MSQDALPGYLAAIDAVRDRARAARTIPTLDSHRALNAAHRDLIAYIRNYGDVLDIQFSGPVERVERQIEAHRLVDALSIDFSF